MTPLDDESTHKDILHLLTTARVVLFCLSLFISSSYFWLLGRSLNAATSYSPSSSSSTSASSYLYTTTSSSLSTSQLHHFSRHSAQDGTGRARLDGRPTDWNRSTEGNLSLIVSFFPSPHLSLPFLLHRLDSPSPLSQTRSQHNCTRENFLHRARLNKNNKTKRSRPHRRTAWNPRKTQPGRKQKRRITARAGQKIVGENKPVLSSHLVLTKQPHSKQKAAFERLTSSPREGER